MAESLNRPWPYQKGPVEILCREIEFPFSSDMERVDLFRAFISTLVDVVETERSMRAVISRLGKEPPSEGSALVLEASREMLRPQTREEHIAASVRVHLMCQEHDPEGHFDDLTDMLRLCASAIRFGLQDPCSSRHAVAASAYIWERRYGINVLDGHTRRWMHDWTRRQFLAATLSLLPD